MSSVLEIKKNYIFVSRASTAIYLVLYTLGYRNKRILVPANLCYAAIYPVIYSGNIPVFCDVDKDSGNVTFECCVKYAHEIDGMILPHMYGNPIGQIDKIAALCNEKSLLLIEDCAVAMGASSAGKLCGSWGDFSVFSMGYSKTIDIGGGGILCSNHDLSEIWKEYQKLPVKTELEVKNEVFFSKLYRLIRNHREQGLDSYIWRGLLPGLRETFIHYESDLSQKCLRAVAVLDQIIFKRKMETELYKELLLPCTYYKKYEYGLGAVPWRYSLLVEPDFRSDLISALLEWDMPVSDWYPVVTPIFGMKGKFPGAKYMERRIINFPLLIGEEKIRSICGRINWFIGEKGRRN